jgi:hypothetical protein
VRLPRRRLGPVNRLRHGIEDLTRHVPLDSPPGVIYAANNLGLFRSDEAGRRRKALDIPWREPALADGVEALACLPE